MPNTLCTTGCCHGNNAKKHLGGAKPLPLQKSSISQRIYFLRIEFLQRKCLTAHFLIPPQSRKNRKPSVNSHRSPLLVQLPHFPEIYPGRQTNGVLSSEACNTHRRDCHARGRAFKRGIRTELNWITPPLPSVMTAINFCKWCRW